MNKKASLITLILFLVTCFVSNAFGADATANVTVNYSTPITIEEIRPFTFTLHKKPGVQGDNVSISNLYNELYSTKQYFASYSYTPGCIKITGNPNGRIKVRITPGTTLVGARGTTLTLGSSRWIAGQIKNSCLTSFSGAIYESTVNGNGYINLDSNGVTYILWFVGGENPNYLFFNRNATFSKIQLDTFTAPVTYEVWYE